MPMFRHGVLALILVVPLFAGCLEPANSSSESPSSAGPLDSLPANATNLLRVIGIATDCTEHIAGRLVESDRAARFLPPGYVPEDAAVVVGRGTPLQGSPVPLGRGFAGMAVVDCASTSFEGHAPTPVTLVAFFIAVKRLNVPGIELDPEPSFQELYVLHWYTSKHPGLPDLLASVGANMSTITARNTFAAGSAPVTAASMIEDADGRLMEFQGTSPSGRERQINVRLWQETTHGLSVFEVRRLPTATYTAAMSSCEARTETWPARVYGTTDCAGADSLGIYFPTPWTSAGTFNFLPGVKPAQ